MGDGVAGCSGRTYEAVEMLVLLRGVSLSLNRKPLLTKLVDCAAEGVADMAHQFLG